MVAIKKKKSSHLISILNFFVLKRLITKQNQLTFNFKFKKFLTWDLNRGLQKANRHELKVLLNATEALKNKKQK